jgi:hypothetical protein
VVASISSILASEDASRGGATGRFRKAEAQKDRMIDGTGVITPLWTGCRLHREQLDISRFELP